MRYQVFNSQAGTQPVFTAPWVWMARWLSLVLDTRWDWYRLVDSHSGKTLTEWARGEGVDGS